MKIKEKIILVAAYRSWATDVYRILKEKNHNHIFILVETQRQLENFLKKSKVDFIFLVGWSWIIPKTILKKNNFFGIHPSDLPKYAGGSPIQHQIIEGVTTTKNTLFKLNEKIDSGRPILKKNLSLKGDIQTIFKNIKNSSINMIDRIIKKGIPKKGDRDFLEVRTTKTVRALKRLTPQNSKIKKNNFTKFTTLEIYNILRCREFPYPNVYIEDEKGKLFFEKVRFEKKR